MSINLTKPAALHVATMTAAKQPIIRIGVTAGGCSGYEYVLDVVDESRFNDRIFTCHGIRIVCDPRSYLYINGTQVDFDGSMMGGGFKFENPNAKRSCGCGTSFQA
jgi:iron-sulfur cluster assembly protein